MKKIVEMSSYRSIIVTNRDGSERCYWSGQAANAEEMARQARYCGERNVRIVDGLRSHSKLVAK